MMYECEGCGEQLDGPPTNPVEWEAAIESFDCDVCVFRPLDTEKINNHEQ